MARPATIVKPVKPRQKRQPKQANLLAGMQPLSPMAGRLIGGAQRPPQRRGSLTAPAKPFGRSGGPAGPMSGMQLLMASLGVTPGSLAAAGPAAQPPTIAPSPVPPILASHQAPPSEPTPPRQGAFPEVTPGRASLRGGYGVGYHRMHPQAGPRAPHQPDLSRPGAPGRLAALKEQVAREAHQEVVGSLMRLADQQELAFGTSGGLKPRRIFNAPGGGAESTPADSSPEQEYSQRRLAAKEALNRGDLKAYQELNPGAWVGEGYLQRMATEGGGQPIRGQTMAESFREALGGEEDPRWQAQEERRGRLHASRTLPMETRGELIRAKRGVSPEFVTRTELLRRMRTDEGLGEGTGDLQAGLLWGPKGAAQMADARARGMEGEAALRQAEAMANQYGPEAQKMGRLQQLGQIAADIAAGGGDVSTIMPLLENEVNRTFTGEELSVAPIPGTEQPPQDIPSTPEASEEGPVTSAGIAPYFQNNPIARAQLNAALQSDDPHAVATVLQAAQVPRAVGEKILQQMTGNPNASYERPKGLHFGEYKDEAGKRKSFWREDLGGLLGAVGKVIGAAGHPGQPGRLR